MKFFVVSKTATIRGTCQITEIEGTATCAANADALAKTSKHFGRPDVRFHLDECLPGKAGGKR